MIRTVFSRALPGLSRPPVCHYSAAAIPAPNTRPEVHYNKVTRAAANRSERPAGRSSPCSQRVRVVYALNATETRGTA